MPASAAARSATRSAMGERQILPKQTKTTRMGRPADRSATSLIIWVGQENVQDKAHDGDDDRTEQCCPESVDVPVEVEQPSKPGREEQHAGIDHDQEQTQGEQYQRCGEKREERLDDRVQDAEDQCYDQQGDDLPRQRRSGNADATEYPCRYRQCSGIDHQPQKQSHKLDRPTNFKFSPCVTQAAASATVRSVRTGGCSGRAMITTGIPRSPAASSLATVCAPPESLVNSASMACSVRIWRSSE